MKYLILIGLLLSQFPHYLLAGNEGASGGDGVLINDTVYSLDLFEAGIETDAYIDKVELKHPKYQTVNEKVKIALRTLKSDELNELVTFKILEISRIDHIMAWAILNTMEAYTWRLVAPELVNISDEESVLNLEGLNLVQLASRQVANIFINRELWKKTPLANQAALVFHETIYALIKPELVREIRKNLIGVEETVWYFKQSSARVRQIVATLFTEALTLQPAKTALATLVGPSIYFPQGNTVYLPNHYYFNDGVVNNLSKNSASFAFDLYGNSNSYKSIATGSGVSSAKRLCDYFFLESPIQRYANVSASRSNLELEFDSLSGKDGTKFFYRKFTHKRVNSKESTYQSHKACVDDLIPYADTTEKNKLKYDLFLPDSVK